MFLFTAALSFVAGNLAATGTAYPHITALACTLSSIAVMALGLRFPGLRILLFPLLGATGASTYTAMLPGAESSSLTESRLLDISGIITDGGLSSSGRPFLEISVGNENTIIYNIPQNTVWMPGDSVKASVRCSEVENFTEDFDYRSYMAKQGIFYTCFYGHGSSMTVTACGRPPVKLIPARMRKRFSAAVDSAIQGDDKVQVRAVVKALAYGYQDEIAPEIEESFRESGAIHLLALSGMHLGLFYGVLRRLLCIIGNSRTARRIRSVIITLALWAFTIFTGCGVSILRAAVMFSIYEAGVIAGRQRNGINALALSAIIITTLDSSAPSGVSFQLSYAAMTAIFLIFPHLRDLVPVRGKILRSIRDVCAMTIACQTTTAPVILLHFGTFAFYSLIANLLCSPLVSVAMFLIPAVLAAPDTGGILTDAPERILTETIELFICINATISNL